MRKRSEQEEEVVVLGLRHWSTEKLSSMRWRSLARSADSAVTWQQRDLSLCIPLSPSRDRWSSSFDYSIFHLALSRFIRADEIQRPVEEERERAANPTRKGPTQRASGETHGRDPARKRREKDRDGEKEERRLSDRERGGMCTRFLQVRWVRSNSLLGRLRSYSSHSDDLSEKYFCYHAVIKLDGLSSIALSLIANKLAKTFIDGILYWAGSSLFLSLREFPLRRSSAESA